MEATFCGTAKVPTASAKIIAVHFMMYVVVAGDVTKWYVDG
jgi:hypothetical protein